MNRKAFWFAMARLQFFYVLIILTLFSVSISKGTEQKLPLLPIEETTMPIRLTQTPTTACVRRDQSSDSGRLRLQSAAHLLSLDRSVLSCLHACARVPPHISSTQSTTYEASQCATRRPRAITSPACTWTARWPDLNDDRPCLDIVGVCVNRIGTLRCFRRSQGGACPQCLRCRSSDHPRPCARFRRVVRNQ